jgi:glycosyltransferase involved in cell wall biosynthesis
MESAVLHGQAAVREMMKMRRQGFTPDVILAHPGWGETLYAKEVFPQARLIHFCEWFYANEGADIGFDPEFPSTLDDRLRIRTWNALHTLNLEQCDVGVTPTQWQWSRHPQAYRDKIQIIHEGIPTDRLGPDPHAWIKTPDGTVLRPGDPVITYVARHLEPYRGFHIFMRALEQVQQRHPHCHALIVGGDGVSYGQRPKDARNWREKMLREVRLDPKRTHFLGRVPYKNYLRVLQISAAHVYLTYPFVLSWSMLEAMASGCLLLGSDTAPVQEVLQHSSNGLHVNFFDAKGISSSLLQVLETPQEFSSARSQARADVQKISCMSGLEEYTRLLAA